MKDYIGLESLISEYDQLPIAGRIYTKPRIDNKNIYSAEFLVFSSEEVDEYVKESGGLIPRQISGNGYFSWLEAPTFNDIVSVALSYKQDAKIMDFEKAIFFYLENDAFYEPSTDV